MVRWSSITLADIDELSVALRTLHQATKRLVTYIAIQDDDYLEPSPDVKDAVRRSFPKLAEDLKYDYLVITAESVRGSLQRSFLRALLTAGRIGGVKHVDKVVVMSTVEEVLSREMGDLPAPPHVILAELRARGILPEAGRRPVSSLSRE